MTDKRIAQLVKLAEKILQDKPDMELSHLAGEIVRATVGVGVYAMPQRQPRSLRDALGKPVKARGR